MLLQRSPVTNYHVVRNANSAQVAILTPKPSIPLLMSSSSPTSTIPEAPIPVKNEEPIDVFAPVQRESTMRPSSDSSSSLPGNFRRSVYKADVVGVDPGKDIAVLKITAPPNELNPIAVGTSKGLRVGQTCCAIGNPFGLDHTLTVGVISGTGREVKSPIGRPISNVIQTDAAINPGKCNIIFHRNQLLLQLFLPGILWLFP